MKKKSPGLVTKIFTVVFACLIVAGLVWYYSGLEKQHQELENSDSKTFADAKVTEEHSKDEEATTSSDSLYLKLSQGKPVNIAIIGDTFGASTGATEGNQWDAQLKNMLSEKYQSEVSINNLSVAVTKAFQGYCTVMNTDWSSCDLAIVCFGSMDQNDNLQTFERDYEAIIRNLRQKNSGMVIVPMISTYVSDSNFSGTVRDIAKHYSLPSVNMNNAFVDSGKDEMELTDSDGVYPNDEGYRLYAQAVLDTIAENIQSDAIIPPEEVKVKYDEVEEMEECEFLPLDDLTYVSDNEYSYTGDAAVIGVEYLPASSGDSKIDIQVNGYTVNTIDCVTSYDLDKTHYAIGATDLEDEDTVSIIIQSGDGMTVNGITVSHAKE